MQSLRICCTPYLFTGAGYRQLVQRRFAASWFHLMPLSSFTYKRGSWPQINCGGEKSEMRENFQMSKHVLVQNLWPLPTLFPHEVRCTMPILWNLLCLTLKTWPMFAAAISMGKYFRSIASLKTCIQVLNCLSLTKPWLSLKISLKVAWDGVTAKRFKQ